MKTILAAFFSGLAGSLGLGGGGVLVLYLVLALGMPQLKAQGINLLFFIPCAVLSSIVYSFKSSSTGKAFCSLPQAVCREFCLAVSRYRT